MSSGGALAGVAAVDELAHFVVFNEFTTVGCGDAFFDFAQKPVLITEHALDGFDDEGLAFPPLLGRSACQLFFEVAIEMNFHKVRLESRKFGVNMGCGFVSPELVQGCISAKRGRRVSSRTELRRLVPRRC